MAIGSRLERLCRERKVPFSTLIEFIIHGDNAKLLRTCFP